MTEPERQGPDWFHRAVATPHRERILEVEGVAIRYLSWGDPALPGLVLVHGGAAHAHWWSFLAPLFSSSFSVAALDLSGHGDSGRRERYTMELWAEELLAVVRDADFVGPPVVVGHSMGGLVSIVAASLYGDRLAGAILVDSPVRRPDPESDEGQRGRSFRNPKTYDTLEEAMSRFRLVPEQPCDNDWALQLIAERSLRRRPDGRFDWKFDRAVFQRREGRPLADFLATVHTRVALIRGQHSRVVSPETGRYMYELLDRNAPLVEIPEAHHHLMLDQPLAFVAAVRALLADWEHSIPLRRRSAARTPAPPGRA